MSEDDYHPNSMDATLSRIETKLDTALVQVADQEKRIGTLERWRMWMLGTAAAASGGAVKIWKWLEITGTKPPTH